jgi:hypothetical protein
LPGYTTNIIFIPEFDLAVTIFTAGEAELLDVLRNMVTVPVVHAAENIAARGVKERYVGVYLSNRINSSVTLEYSLNHGLEITSWISNSTDMLSILPKFLQIPPTRRPRAQIIPTGLYHDQKKERGEIWRIALTSEVKRGEEGDVWDDWCVSNLDLNGYAGQAVNEVVFWRSEQENEANAEGQGEEVRGRADVKVVPFDEIELTGFRVRLRKERNGQSDEPLLVVQEL